MNPLVKKVVAAVAIKEAIEKVQEMRRPKPSLWSRMAPLAFVAAAGGALFYLSKSGRLSPVVAGVKDKVGPGSSSNGSAAWDGGPSPTTPSTSGSPTPSTI